METASKEMAIKRFWKLLETANKYFVMYVVYQCRRYALFIQSLQLENAALAEQNDMILP